MRYIIKHNINNSKFDIGILYTESMLAIVILTKLDVIKSLCQLQKPNI